MDVLKKAYWQPHFMKGTLVEGFEEVPPVILENSRLEHHQAFQRSQSFYKQVTHKDHRKNGKAIDLPPFLKERKKIASVGAFRKRTGKPLELIRLDEPLSVGYFFGAGNHEPLPALNHLNVI